MTKEAKLVPTPAGLVPEGSGWFVVNAKRSAWFESKEFGRFTRFEGDAKFQRLGFNLHVLQPGQPACKYHAETAEEAFLVLSGRCTLIVEDEERALGPWDVFYCAPNTHHVFVGSGDGPCTVLMMGAREPDLKLDYPVNALAAEYGASSAKDTPDPREAYAGIERPTPVPYAQTDRTLGP
jgi:uncharacterized cupin superfamily protein